MYGLAATQLIRHREIVKTPRGDVTIYFLLPEDKGSPYWGLHPTTLICVESRVTTFLGDDINGIEIQSHTDDHCSFFNPSLFLVTPSSSQVQNEKGIERRKKLLAVTNILFIHDKYVH